MKDRAAIDTIRGYLYQFDYTIEMILNQADENYPVVIEGIEDIDVTTKDETVAIQCKYYENTEYIHSIIAKPIRLMLYHFNEVKQGKAKELKYKLRGYYKSGQGKLSLPIDIDFLKQHFLTFTRSENVSGISTKVTHIYHTDLGLTDIDLLNFISKLEIDINAKEFEKQNQDIIASLKNEFQVTSSYAGNFYYNNALRVIRDLSKESNILARSITKKDFKEKIDTAKILFDEWFVFYKGEKAHFANLKAEFIYNFSNLLYKERYFLFEINPIEYSRFEVKTIIDVIIRKFKNIKKQPIPFCPYVYFHGIDTNELIEIKKDYQANEISFVDGFDFEGATFNKVSISKKASSENDLSLRFINKLDYIEEILSITGRKSFVYQFYLTNPFFQNNNKSIHTVTIQLNKFINLKNII